MKILIIDNYDSFTYNLYQLVGSILNETNFEIDVIRNNLVDCTMIYNKNYDRIIISPGPGNPKSTNYFGNCLDIIQNASKVIPTLGVCLGMQGIAIAFGCDLTKSNIPVHGKQSSITHNGEDLFINIPQNISVMRYHSLKVIHRNCNQNLEVTATCMDSNEEEETVMAIKHKSYPIYGIQFHPESFATEAGKQIVSNFLDVN